MSIRTEKRIASVFVYDNDEQRPKLESYAEKNGHTRDDYLIFVKAAERWPRHIPYPAHYIIDSKNFTTIANEVISSGAGSVLDINSTSHCHHLREDGNRCGISPVVGKSYCSRHFVDDTPLPAAKTVKEKPSCNICLLDYDKKSRTPMIGVTCGHGLCKSCSDHLLDGGRISCPFCREKTIVTVNRCFLDALDLFE